MKKFYLFFLFCLLILGTAASAKVPSVTGSLKNIRKAPSLEGTLVQRKNRLCYQFSDGTYARSMWLNIDGKYYYFTKSGYMRKGWLDYNGKRYYLKKTGEALTGWDRMGKKWRYFKANGVLTEYKRTDQILMVQADGSQATVTLIQKINPTTWKEVYRTTGFVGRLGVGTHTEGVPNTPKGTYTFGVAFGVNADPGTAFSYTQVDDSHYWVDDADSSYYNQFVSSNEVSVDWDSAEHLIDYPTAYAYALSLNYNTKGIKGKGSAIFLHCSTGGPTVGCISVPEEAMSYLLQNLQTNARIIIK